MEHVWPATQSSNNLIFGFPGFNGTGTRELGATIKTMMLFAYPTSQSNTGKQGYKYILHFLTSVVLVQQIHFSLVLVLVPIVHYSFS